MVEWVSVTLAELRAGLPAIAAALDRRTVNVVAQALGMAIINPDDPEL